MTREARGGQAASLPFAALCPGDNLFDAAIYHPSRHPSCIRCANANYAVYNGRSLE